MGRPRSNTAVYFSHFAGMRNHKKVKLLKAKFGPLKGYAFWNMFLEWLCECENIEWEYCDLECEMIAAELAVSETEIKEMVDYCLKIEMLHKNESNFIYSKSLKENLEPLFEKRKREREKSKFRNRNEEGKFIENKVSATDIPRESLSATDIPQTILEKTRLEKKNEYMPYANDKSDDLSLSLPVIRKIDLEEYSKLPRDITTIYKFIQEFKPIEIEPYRDIWNLFAEKYKFAQVLKINAHRKKHLSARLRDKEFDFCEILKCASKSKFIIENSFFTFDWVISSETNYIKVLEGNFIDKEKSIPKEDKPKTLTDIRMEEGRAVLCAIHGS